MLPLCGSMRFFAGQLLLARRLPRLRRSRLACFSAHDTVMTGENAILPRCAREYRIFALTNSCPRTYGTGVGGRMART
jgi:hypothetical protein